MFLIILLYLYLIYYINVEWESKGISQLIINMYTFDSSSDKMSINWILFISLHT